MEIIEIKKELVESKRAEYIIKFKDFMNDTIRLILLPEYALITGSWVILIRLDKNINPYMRLAELVAKDPVNDYYDYFKKKIIENHRKEKFDSEATKEAIEEYIKFQLTHSIIEDYTKYRSFNKESWISFFGELDFNYKNEYFLVNQVFQYVQEKDIDDITDKETFEHITSLIVYSEVNYERYRAIFNLLQQFFSKTITKEAILEYYAEKEKQEA